MRRFASSTASAESSAASRASSAARSSLGLVALQLGGDRLQPLGDLAQAAHRHRPRRSRTDRAEDAVDEAGRVGAAVLLGDLDRLVDRDLGRDVVAVLDLVQRDPHHVALQRRDPVELPALAWRGDLRVELLAVGLDALGQLAGERARVGEQLVERAPGDVALVAGEDGVAALVGSAHAAYSRASAAGALGARDVLAAAGVDPDRSRPPR